MKGGESVRDESGRERERCRRESEGGSERERERGGGLYHTQHNPQWDLDGWCVCAVRLRGKPQPLSSHMGSRPSRVTAKLLLM